MNYNKILLLITLISFPSVFTMEEKQEVFPKLSRLELKAYSNYVKLFKIIEQYNTSNDSNIDIFKDCPFQYHDETKKIFLQAVHNCKSLFIKPVDLFFEAIELSSFIQSELKENYKLLPELIHLANYMQFQTLLNALMILCITNNIDLDTTAFSESVVNTYIRFQYYLSLDHNQLFSHINISGGRNARSKKSNKRRTVKKTLNIVLNKIKKLNNKKIISAFPYQALVQDGIIQNPIPVGSDVQYNTCYSDFDNSKNLQYLKHYTLLPKQAQEQLTKKLKEITYQLLDNSIFDTFLENITDFALRQKMITYMISWIEKNIDIEDDDEIESSFKKFPEGLVKMALRFMYIDKNYMANLGALIDKYRVDLIKEKLHANKRTINLENCFTQSPDGLPTEFIMPIIELAQPLYNINNTSINLQGNNLSAIPAGLERITNLTKLNLRSNKINDIDANISQLIRLKELNLSKNEFKQFPQAICYLKSLKTLDIGTNGFNSIPQEIGNLSDLTTLELCNCWCLTQLPDNIKELINLQRLNIKETKITINNIPKALKEQLGKNLLTGHFISYLTDTTSPF